MVPAAMSKRLEEAVAHHRAGRFIEAEPLYRLELESTPANALVQGLFGDVLYALGRDAQAELAYRAALRVNPNLPTVQVNLGLVLRRQKKFAAAADALAQAVRLYPGLPEAHMNYGLALQDVGHLDEAIAAHRRALVLRPDHADALLNLGSALHARRDYDEAAQAYEAALRQRPDYAEAHYCLGVTRFDRGDVDGARLAYQCALELRPVYEECRDNLAYVLQVLGRYGETAALYRQGATAESATASSARYLALASLYDPAADHRLCYAEQRRAEDRFARPLYAQFRPHTNSRAPDRQLRIGYLTSDFRDHPLGRNVEPLLAHRNRKEFEVVAYADVAKPDMMTAHLRGLVDLWRPIEGQSDVQVADLIRTDGIDLLVLLAGHFDRNRPLVCARRPAPVQLSFHDLMTSGLEAVDYFIADRTVYPASGEEQFTERVIRLPSIYVHAPLATVPVGLSPRDSKGVVTFGSFNNPAKINERVVTLWAQLLRTVPDSQLALKYRNWFLAPSIQARVRAGLSAQGIDPQRVRFIGNPDSAVNHLERYRDVDIALDPFPFSGSTTTFEALWMGVPVVTLAGPTIASRWSASMLRVLKLDELIAETPDQYVSIAAALAGDAARLADLRATLRERIAGSPLTDGRLRARQIERVYRAVWRRWCRVQGAP
jgi:predicted O-linked N-acetylglucosamine transferase (SPINDLY family)